MKTRKTIMDLTLPVDTDMRGVEIETARTLDVNGWNATTLKLYSHSGTHLDAPRHFLPDGPTLETLPLTACVGPARVINLTPIGPRELITVERLAPWLDTIEPGDRLLLRTDWYRRHGTPDYRDALPRIDVDLARRLVEKEIALIGVEPPSVADVNNGDELKAVHRVLLEAGVVIVEGLANLDTIATKRVELIVLPLRIVGGDGSPVRAIAIEIPDGA